jgi:hypothetical protein
MPDDAKRQCPPERISLDLVVINEMRRVTKPSRNAEKPTQRIQRKPQTAAGTLLESIPAIPEI